MQTQGSLVCPSCRYRNEDDAKLCSMCGALFARAPRPAAVTPVVPPTAPPPVDAPPVDAPAGAPPIGTQPSPAPGPDARPSLLAAAPGKLAKVPPSVLYIGAGALIALALHKLTCGVFDLGVHLLAHECLGHAVFGWLMGRMAIPSIYFTTWTEPSRFIEVLILAGLAGGAWKLHKEERRPLAIGLAAAAVVYPVLAFTAANEVLCIAGGHLGEVLWGAFFFYRAARGGFFQDQERPLYAALGWFLWVGNVVLFFNLATSGPHRAAYESIVLVEGTSNDFIRVAEACHSTLARVSAVMLVVSLVVPPVGGLLGWWRATSQPLRAPW